MCSEGHCCCSCHNAEFLNKCKNISYQQQKITQKFPSCPCACLVAFPEFQNRPCRNQSPAHPPATSRGFFCPPRLPEQHPVRKTLQCFGHFPKQSPLCTETLRPIRPFAESRRIDSYTTRVTRVCTKNKAILGDDFELGGRQARPSRAVGGYFFFRKCPRT